MKISVLVARLRRAHALMTVRQPGPELTANPAEVISGPESQTPSGRRLQARQRPPLARVSVVTAELSCELLTAANDQRWGADVAFGSPINDEPAAVLVHAETPRGAG